MLEILTPGQRLNHLRVTLLNNATQKELCGSYSRNRISQIENGGTLTSDFAEVIAKNIENMCNDKNIQLDIKNIYSYLMESKEDQIENYFAEQKKILMELKLQEDYHGIFEDALEELIALCEKYNIKYNTKIEIYFIATDFYYEIKEYDQAMQCILTASDLAVKESIVNDIIKTTAKQLKIYIKTFMFEEVISKYSWLMSILENATYDKNLLIDTMINAILAYRYLHQYSKLLELSNELITNFELTSAYFVDIKNIEANYYFSEKNYEKAREIWEEVRNISAESNLTDMFAVSACNLAELSLEENDIIGANDYIERALKVKNISTIDYILQMYHIALKIKVKVNNLHDVETYFSKCFELGRKNKNKKIVIDSCKEVFYFYLKENHKGKILYLLDIIEIAILKEDILDREILDSFVESAYYFKEVDKNISENIMCRNYNLIKKIQKK